MSDKLKSFEAWGVKFSGKRGNQAFGVCPFCSKEDKLYVNVESLLWDCKVCGRKGNLNTFLEESYKLSLEFMTKDLLNKLSIDRGLPLKAFDKWKIGYREGRYVVPIRNEKGVIQDLRTYTKEQKMRSTIGCHVGLFGMDILVRTDIRTPVYLCEGEWDCIAMQWLLEFLKEDGICVGVPGANTFKTEWNTFFQGRDVICCYDHDEAGIVEELRAQSHLTGVAKSLKFLHWSELHPDGYDLRDLIVEKAIKGKKPSEALSSIEENLNSVPRRCEIKAEEYADGKIPPKVTLEDVKAVFSKWLYMRDFTGLEVALATVISTEIEGDPLWMFLVAAPGGSKTELLQSLCLCPNIYMTSTITSKALISGSPFINGTDPSLLPRLHQKTLINKDFTTVLAQKEQEKSEIFGTLRDAYDGSASKDYGTGQHRSYVSHFSILAGVTPKIYELGSEHQSFGERFLKCVIGDNLIHEFEEDMITKAVSNVGFEDSMRPEMAEIIKKYMAYTIWFARNNRPTIPASIQKKIVNLARFGARMRGTVGRDKFRNDIMTSKPSAEYGTRFAKQVYKLCLGAALENHRIVVTEQDYRTAVKVVRDTISQRMEDVLRCLYKGLPTIDDTFRTKDIAYKTRYTSGTISQILSDMDILGIVIKTGKTNAFEWTVSEYIRDLIKKAEIYK